MVICGCTCALAEPLQDSKFFALLRPSSGAGVCTTKVILKVEKMFIPSLLVFVLNIYKCITFIMMPSWILLNFYFASLGKREVEYFNVLFWESVFSILYFFCPWMTSQVAGFIAEPGIRRWDVELEPIPMTNRCWRMVENRKDGYC